MGYEDSFTKTHQNLGEISTNSQHPQGIFGIRTPPFSGLEKKNRSNPMWALMIWPLKSIDTGHPSLRDFSHKITLKTIEKSPEILNEFGSYPDHLPLAVKKMPSNKKFLEYTIHASYGYCQTQAPFHPRNLQQDPLNGPEKT